MRAIRAGQEAPEGADISSNPRFSKDFAGLNFRGRVGQGRARPGKKAVPGSAFSVGKGMDEELRSQFVLSGAGWENPTKNPYKSSQGKK